MTKTVDWRGVHIPIITPFKDDAARTIDEQELRRLVNYLIEVQKADGLVPCGTTGESPTLNYEEHEKVIEIVIDEANGRVPIIAGTGSNCTKEAIEMTVHAENAGADATLQVGPYYNKPTMEGMFAHFKAVAEATSLPILIYNIPGRTSKNIEPKTLIKLWQEVPNIVGVKDTAADLNQTMELIKATRGQKKPFFVLAGEDLLIYAGLALGGHGGISAAGHVVGAELKQMCNLMLEKKEKDYQAKALDIHYRISDIVKTLFIETNPAPIKAALKMMNVTKTDVLRLPLVQMQASNIETLRQSLIKLGKIKA